MPQTARNPQTVSPWWIVRDSGRKWRGVIVFLLVLIPAQVQAQLTCEGNIRLSYPAQSSNTQGSVVVVGIGLGAGEVLYGAQLTINQLFFDLDCAAASLPGCSDQGAIIGYEGDSSILNDCGVTVASNNPAGGAQPNHIVFTLTPPLVIPAGMPDACHVWFEVIRLTGSDPDGTPYGVEERAGYDKAECDNGLSVAQVVPAALFIATASPTPTPTPSPTPTFTATPTPTSCGVEVPQLDPVTSPTNLLQQTITGYARLTGARWLSVCGEAGCVNCSIGSPNCTANGTSFQIAVPLVPLQVNHVRVCDENDNSCGGPTEACTSVEIIQTCTGDCGGTFSVTVDEILTVANIALGNAGVGTCVTGDDNDDGQITVDEILVTVNNALSGCPK